MLMAKFGNKILKLKRNYNTDLKQLKFMNEEFCILVDEQDKIIGKETKKFCHLNENLKNNLHRAFSVFLFNEKNELLLQQRSEKKITFPLYWTNTCCSHPIYNEEIETKGIEGAKYAARRKLEHELGIPRNHFQNENFEFLTKILYQSKYNDKWGEYELDYIFIVKLSNENDFKLQVCPEEVKAVEFVNKTKLKEILKNESLLKTPWFRMISNKFLFQWWDHLDNLKSFKDFDKIYKLK
eukprot:gene4122-7408_t